MPARLMLSAAATLASSLFLAWVIAGSSAAPLPASAANFEVTFTCCTYSPANLIINVNDTVTWKGSFSAHPLVSQDGLWPTQNSGSEFTFQFTTPGQYFFYCQIHGGPNGAGMAGKVVVQGASSTPTPTPTPGMPPGPVGASASTRLAALLLGANEVPSTTSPATGYALFEVASDLSQLTFVLSTTVTSTTAAHIHRGRFGENGPVLITLAATAGFTEVRGTIPIGPEVAAALFSGDLYVNVHSTLFPGGEVRGQIVGLPSFAATLSGAQEVPPVPSTASGRFQLWLWPDLSRFDYVLTHTIAAATGAHIHRGESSAVGPVVIPLPTGTSVSGTVPITPGGVFDLLNGNWYVNIHSAAYPGGEIRGQLQLVRNFQAVLSGSAEVPPTPSTATGVASFLFDRSTGLLSYALATSGITPTAAHLHVGPVGTNGPILAPLIPSPGVTTARGVIALSAAQALLLETSGLYVNVHSAAYPGGEIRGQVQGPTLYRARLSGAQEVPSAANSFSGLAFVLLNDGQNGFFYAYSSDVPSPTAAHIHRGAIGVVGPIVSSLAVGPQAAGSSGIAPADVRDLATGNLYVNIHNAQFPDGAVRGQLLAGQPLYLSIAFKGNPSG
jgi:plastocyanin